MSDDEWPEGEFFGHPVHPRAKELVDDTSLLWAPDLGVLEHDRGHCAAEYFVEWRAEHPDVTLGELLAETLATWDVPTVYGDDLLRDDVIQQQIEADPHFDVDFEQAVWVLDVTVLASAFAQLVLEGRIDADAKPTVRFAIRRQLHPLVLAEIYRSLDVRAQRIRILEALPAIVDRA